MRRWVSATAGNPHQVGVTRDRWQLDVTAGGGGGLGGATQVVMIRVGFGQWAGGPGTTTVAAPAGGAIAARVDLASAASPTQVSVAGLGQLTGRRRRWRPCSQAMSTSRGAWIAGRLWANHLGR